MKSNEKSRVVDKSRHQGFSLIEVLVALLVLSIGLLGLAALQTTSLKFNSDSLARTQATYLTYDIVDRMRSNPLGVSANNYNVPNATSATTAASNACVSSSCACDNAGASCSASDLAAYDLVRWYERLQSLLPGASTNLATISRDAITNIVTIQINWTERDQAVSQTWVIQL